MEKINIAELLKDCPKGMELDCLVFEDVTLYKIDTDIENEFPIRIKTKNDYFLDLTKYGTYSNVEEAKCVIFPKGKTTWEGFVPPCKFKDGDILTTNLGSVFILKEPNEDVLCYSCYVALNDVSRFITSYTKFCIKNGCRLATEEEKAELFKAIKDNGYRWNPETKTLEKLPKFKVGDVIVNIYRKHLNGDSRGGKIYQIENDKYIFTDGSYIHIQDQNNWELVPNKFDITTLKPFDKVFVRDNNTQEWVISFFSHCNGLEIYKYSCINGCGYAQCVPYEENKHLLGTTNDCNDFYKTWK